MTKEDMDLFREAMKCIGDCVCEIQTHSHRDIYNVLGGMYEPVRTCDVLKYPDFYGMNNAEHIVESVRTVIEAHRKENDGSFFNDDHDAIRAWAENAVEEACALLDRTLLTEYAKKMLDNAPKENK